MPDKEKIRQASLPLNSLDLELGTPDLRGELQAAEASDAGTPPVERADRLPQVKTNFRSVACAVVCCVRVHHKARKQYCKLVIQMSGQERAL